MTTQPATIPSPTLSELAAEVKRTAATVTRSHADLTSAIAAHLSAPRVATYRRLYDLAVWAYTQATAAQDAHQRTTN